MLGANQKISELLEKIKHDAEETLIKQESESKDAGENLFDFSIKAFKLDDFSQLESLDELLASIFNFIEHSLKHLERVYIQLREWYATHTPEAPHIMHIPLHPAAALTIHSEALRQLGSDFNSFDEYEGFLKRVRSQLDVCSNSKQLLMEQRKFLESSDLSYIYYQLPKTEKQILVKTLQDFRPAIENILLNFQNYQEHMPGNFYVEGGFIGSAFSEINNTALELYRVKKIITLIKEGMPCEHINLYQKVFESQLRLNKMLSKAITEHGIESFQAQLYSAQAEAGRLAKKYIEETHQVTQSKLILDREQASTWFKEGKPTIKHPLHRDNPQNFLTEIRADFLETKDIKKITALYQTKDSKYQQTLKRVSNKQKLIEKFINFDRNSTIDESEIIRIILLLHKGNGSLTKNIDANTIKETLQNIGINSLYLDNLEQITAKVTGNSFSVSFENSILSLLELKSDLDNKKLKQFIAIYLNSQDNPFIKEQRLCAKLEDNESKSFLINPELIKKILEKQNCEESIIQALEEHLQKFSNEKLDIKVVIDFFHRYEQEQGNNTEVTKLREIINKIYFLTARLSSHSLYQNITRLKFQYHDEFFKLAGNPKEQSKMFQKYRYLAWAQRLSEQFTKADDALLELLIQKKLNFKISLESLTYLSQLNSSRHKLIHSLSTFTGESTIEHLLRIESNFLENFKNESNIFATFARGGSLHDIRAMDKLGDYTHKLYLNILECKKHESTSREDSGSHRLARQQYYSLWGLRSGLYHNLNRLKEKDVYVLKEQLQRLLQIGEQLQKVVQETNHNRWSGYMFEDLNYQLLEQKWFQKIELINDFLRGSRETKEALDLFGLCDKNFQFDKNKAERLLSDFKAKFIEQALNHKDFKNIYRIICFNFDNLKQDRDPFFQLLIFSLSLSSKVDYYQSLSTKFSRYSEKERSSFHSKEQVLEEICRSLDTLAIKVAKLNLKLDIQGFLLQLKQTINTFEKEPSSSNKEQIIKLLDMPNSP